MKPVFCQHICEFFVNFFSHFCIDITRKRLYNIIWKTHNNNLLELSKEEVAMRKPTWHNLSITYERLRMAAEADGDTTDNIIEQVASVYDLPIEVARDILCCFD